MSSPEWKTGHREGVHILASVSAAGAQDWVGHPGTRQLLELMAGGGLSPQSIAEVNSLAAQVPAEQRLRLLAGWSLLLDLHRWGAEVWLEQGQLLMRVAEERVLAREQLRRQLLSARAAQLQKPAVKAFLRSMETAQLYHGRFYSIFSLMRAGDVLAQQLEEVRRGTVPVERVIQPYIQVVSGSERCAETGLLLRDVWRYFRYTWTLPYHASPGRGVMVLIRDGATVPSAVIGIGMLASVPPQLAVRDEWIGWGAAGLFRQLKEGAKRTDGHQWAAWLEERLTIGLQELYVQDFLEEGLLSPAELHRPTGETLLRLRTATEQLRAGHRRTADTELKDKALRLTRKTKRLLAQLDSEGEVDTALPPQLGMAWEKLARLPLYRWRRAELLGELLRVKKLFRSVAPAGLSADDLPRLLKNEEGRHCVGWLARRMKAERMGTALADVAVCGAIAPYQGLLGGKLVALLMASAEVREAFLSRYRATPSVIASALAGRPVVRRPELVLLTTTSLYGPRSSQYNRLTLPEQLEGLPEGVGPGYLPIGTSDGYGTLQLSTATLDLLSRVVSQTERGRKLTSLPGEGSSPKLRKARAGLERLGVDSVPVLRHGVQRGILIAPLAKNAQAYLQGRASSPQYFVRPEDGGQSTEALLRFWVRRWLSKRLRSDEVLKEVSGHKLTWPISHGARVSAKKEEREEASTE